MNYYLEELIFINNEENLVIYKKAETVLNLIYPALTNFPNAEKHSLCKKIKNSFINLIKNIMLANKVKSKRNFYQNKADGNLQVCKILIKLSYNQKYINENFYKDLSLKLSEIGRILSGWIKSS